ASHSISFQPYAPHPDLHSFPTRRSSDLYPRDVRPLRPARALLARVLLVLKEVVGRPGDAWRILDDGPVRRTVCIRRVDALGKVRSEEHTSELQSRFDLVCRLLLEKKK